MLWCIVFIIFRIVYSMHVIMYHCLQCLQITIYYVTIVEKFIKMTRARALKKITKKCAAKN